MSRRASGLLASVALVGAALTGCQSGDTAGATEVREWAACDGYVALTYDDGPSEYTAAVSDALVAEGMTATFFLLGENIDAHPEAVAGLVESGHEIATHTMTHPDLVESWQPSYVETEIAAGAKAVEAATGQTPQWFRSPYGSTNDDVRAAVKDAGMQEALWSLDTFDWKGLTAKEIAATFDVVKDGDIVLMHDNDQADVDAIPLIAEQLSSKNLCAGVIASSDTDVQVWEGLTHRAVAVAP